MSPAVLNAWVNGAWTPVDLRGLPGDVGPAGAAGSYTWPASNYQNYTNTKAMGDSATEPGPLALENNGSNPCTRVYASNTSRVEVLRSGVMFVGFKTGMSVGSTGDGWINIRKVTPDTILAGGFISTGETDVAISGMFPVTTGDILYFMLAKITGSTPNVSSVIRTVLLV